MQRAGQKQRRQGDDCSGCSVGSIQGRRTRCFDRFVQFTLAAWPAAAAAVCAEPAAQRHADRPQRISITAATTPQQTHTHTAAAAATRDGTAQQPLHQTRPH